MPANSQAPICPSCISDEQCWVVNSFIVNFIAIFKNRQLNIIYVQFCQFLKLPIKFTTNYVQQSTAVTDFEVSINIGWKCLFLPDYQLDALQDGFFTLFTIMNILLFYYH